MPHSLLHPAAVMKFALQHAARRMGQPNLHETAPGPRPLNAQVAQEAPAVVTQAKPQKASKESLAALQDRFGAPKQQKKRL